MRSSRQFPDPVRQEFHVATDPNGNGDVWPIVSDDGRHIVPYFGKAARVLDRAHADAAPAKLTDQFDDQRRLAVTLLSDDVNTFHVRSGHQPISARHLRELLLRVQSALPYSAPWQLRPAAAVRVVGFNQTAAFYEAKNGENGTNWVSVLTGAFQVGKHWAPMARIAWTSSHPPGPTPSGHALANALIGATYARKFSHDLRFASFMATTLPFGEGGGNQPDAGASRAQSDALRSWSQMDNALFVPNYWTVLGGMDLAWVAHGVTIQG